MGIRQDQCNKVCRIIDDYLANRPRERDELIVAVRTVFKEADRKTENSSEKPNNCEYEDIFEYCPRCGMRILVSKPKDEPSNSEKPNNSKVSEIPTSSTISKMEQVEPQTERIKTLDYCDICNHEGCDNCIANNLDDYCVPSGYKPITQTETQNSNLTFEKDECAKEYEELGLKELKELIKADRKTENSSEIPNNCEDEDIFEYCPRCGMRMLSKWYEPQTEVETMSCAECKHRPIGAEICEEACHYEPQTDWHYDEQDATWYPYKHEDEPQTDVYDYKGNGKWERSE